MTNDCSACGERLVLPSDDGCRICWHGPESGLLHYDDTAGGGYVHQHCLDRFDVDTVLEYEREWLD